MGTSPSKEELLYQEVQNGNHDAVKSLRREGASLEWLDKEGRTPLLLACSRGELLDMTITLLNLGANLKAYCSGSHGGYALHYAAKRGLDKTVTLLLSRGALPLSVNDDGQTPLEMARSRGHAAVVRLLEEHLCLFSGIVRELSGPGILETLAPNLVTRKVWAVVLPHKSCTSGGAPEYELAIYESPKLSLWKGNRASSAHPAGLCNVAQPRTVIALAKAEMERPDFSLAEPVLCILEKAHKTKLKLFPHIRGDKNQLKNLYRACKGISEGQNGTSDVSGCREVNTREHDHQNLMQLNAAKVQSSQHKLSPVMQPILQSVSAPSSGRFTAVRSNKLDIAESVMSEELALALALNESLRTATVDSLPVFNPSDACLSKDEEWSPSYVACNRWNHQQPSGHYRAKTVCSNAHKVMKSASQRWTKSSTRLLTRSVREVSNIEAPVAATDLFPSAPPLKAHTHHSSSETGSKSEGTCVVCWDAPVEGACIPCGHLAGCMNCMTKVHGKGLGCPVCRGSIEQVIKVYTV